MVSFHRLFPEVMDQRKMIFEESERNSKKRKWHDDVEANSDDIELHLETPLPSEWQRCLDIQSGEIHFYNTRTHKKTVRDPRDQSNLEKPKIEPPSSPDNQNGHMSLDLELNLLPCRRSSSISALPTTLSEKTSINPGMITKRTNKKIKLPPYSESLSFMRSSTMLTKQTNNYNSGAPKSEEEEEEVVEMVATACMRCHMLVMLCKSSPTCPNCKFVHPPYHIPPELFKPRLSLSSC